METLMNLMSLVWLLLLVLICSSVKCDSTVEKHVNDGAINHISVDSTTSDPDTDTFASIDGAAGNHLESEHPPVVFDESMSEFENKMDVSATYNDSANQGDFPHGHMKKLGEHQEVTEGEIPVLDYMIGGEDFYEFFIRKRQPVLFKGVTRDWMATRQWKNESYILEKYGDELFDVEMGKVYKTSQHPRKTMTMKEFLGQYKNTSSMYLDSPFPQSPMMNDLNVPLMMQCDKLYRTFASAHLLYSNGNTSCPLHFDGYENFLALMSGTKVAYIAHPKYYDELYINNYHDFPGLSPVNPENVDFVKFPKFAQVPFHKLTLQAGDLLYIPEGWYHQVRSYHSPNIAVSMWFHYFQNDTNEDFRDPSKKLVTLAKLINEYPETIECSNQAVTMHSFDKITLENIADRKDVKRDDTFINNTVLHEEVFPGEGVIYVGSDDRWIYAIDMVKGLVKWKVETEKDTGSTCAFSPDGFTVYCGADDSYIRAMHIGNGSVKWAFKTGAAVISSALVDSFGVIYIGSLDHRIYAIHPNGTLKWKKSLRGEVWSSPAFDSENNVLYIASSNDKFPLIYALKKENGDVIWKHRPSGGVISSPRLNAALGEVYFADKVGNVLSFDTLQGRLLHKFSAGDDTGIWSTPAIYNKEVLFVLSLSGRLLAFELKQRQLLWQLELGESKRGSNSSPYIGRDGMLYVGGGNGTVFAIHPENGEVKWKTDIGGGIFFSSPRLGKDNNLFIGSIDGPLYSLDSRSGEIVWSVKTNGPLVGTPLISRGFT